MKRYIKYFICLFIFSFFLCDTVLADECDAEDMARAKVLAENVDVKYEYVGIDEEYGDKYHITISGIVEGIEFGIKDYTKEYETLYTSESPDVKDGTLEYDIGVGEIIINVYSLNCFRNPLRTETINLYGKNLYAYSEECKKLEKYNLDVCDEDYQGYLSYDEFYKIVTPLIDEEEKKEKYISNFIKNNVWIFACGGILLFGLVVFLIYRHRKRSVLE